MVRSRCDCEGGNKQNRLYPESRTPFWAGLSSLFTLSWSLLKRMSIELVMPSDHLSSVTPFSSCPQSFPASRSFPISQLYALGGQSIRASASANSLSNEYSGLISFRVDWFDLLAVQGTLKSLLQHHSSP